ncbi:MAG: PIG-L family deacetylase [Dehalococcoidales bacterium]|nr:PIG-L family deacetylase [Dehalococcoidales bacterium]
MKKSGTLVFIGAHPDDETFGIGATLASYAAAGVKVYYICATRGEAGEADPEFMEGYAATGDMRWAELQRAADVLGLSGLFYLGYRDSGMADTESNRHPEALAAASLEEVTGKIVKILRQLKPDVVITFDPVGGYRHPDHIACHKATVKAFHACGDPGLYPEAGLYYQPKKLYFSIFPHRWMRLMVRLMPLFGRNPHKFGRNGDIDLAEMVKTEFPIHAAVRLDKKYLLIREKAAACHASQMAGGSPRRGIMGLYNRIFGQRDYFMRAYPVPSRGRRETDLFEGIEQS